MTEEEARRYNAFPVICGHIGRADQLKWFPERRVITALREPIDRCLSFSHCFRSLSPDSAPVAADAHRLPVMELIETEEAQRNLHNTMVRQLDGHMLDASVDFPALLEKAKATLRAAFSVGMPEHDGCGFRATRRFASPAHRNESQERHRIEASDPG